MAGGERRQRRESQRQEIGGREGAAHAWSGVQAS
jgi:hypothetical protein